MFFLAASSASDATLGRFFERNVTRSWDRLRRKAQKAGVRPLRVHDARHTLASLTLAAGKRVRWVASQLGHANPELTLRVYAHALREEETDLSFLDFGATDDSGGLKRHPGDNAARRGSERPKPPARVREGALEVWSTRPDSNWHSLRTPDAHSARPARSYDLLAHRSQIALKLTTTLPTFVRRFRDLEPPRAPSSAENTTAPPAES